MTSASRTRRRAALGWQPLFAGQFTANPPAATVQYSTSHNPCRVDLSVNPPGCEPANWGPLPADLSSVGAIRVDFGGLVLNPNDSITFSWRMAMPADAPVGAVAWNSFGYVATRPTTAQLLESAEPPKVGLQVEGPDQPPCRPALHRRRHPAARALTPTLGGRSWRSC